MRYADLLEGLGLDPTDTARLREDAAAVDRLRPAERG
jgi:hypothetical protein